MVLIGPLPPERDRYAHMRHSGAGAPRLLRRRGFRSGGCRDFAAAGAAISQRSRSPSLRIQPLLNSRHRRRQQDNRRRKRPKQPPARTSRGRDKEGTLAAMKALWRELADPKIKEHHGPVVKTTRLARSRAGKAGCRLVSRRSDQGQAAPALAPVLNRVTPGF